MEQRNDGALVPTPAWWLHWLARPEMALVADWIAAVPGLTEKLKQGARVAELAPGNGNAAAVLGRAFPNATVYIQRRELERWAWAVSLPRAMDWLKQGVSTEDLAGLLHLAGEGRLRLVDGLCDDVFPGVSLVPDFDTHTYGHQHVVIRNESSGVWVVPGDVMYLYANIEGIGGDGRYVPIGLAIGSQLNCMLALNELMQVTGGQTSRAAEYDIGGAGIRSLRIRARRADDEIGIAVMVDVARRGDPDPALIAVLGGPQSKLLVSLVYDSVVSFHWPQAAALAFTLLAIALTGAGVILALVRPGRVQGGRR